MYNKKNSVWSVPFVLATLMLLALSTTVQMLNASLSPFANDMWQSKTMGGLLTSFFNIGSIAMAFVAGVMIEKVGKKVSLFVSIVTYTIAVVFFVVAPLKGVALAARFLHGMAKGCIMVGTASIVAEVVPSEKLNEGMGIYGLGNTFSLAIGPLLALNLMDYGYNPMFLVCALIMGLSALAPLFLKKQKAVSVESICEDAEPERTYKGIWRFVEKQAILSSVIFTMFWGSLTSVLVFLAVYAEESLYLTSGQTSLFFTVATVAMLIVRLFAGRLADKHGEFKVVIPGYIAVILMQVLLAFLSNGSFGYAIFLLAGVFYGVSFAIVMPVINTIAVADSPRNRATMANATFYCIMDFGILFASAVCGWLMDRMPTKESGYTVMFMVCLALGVVSMLLTIIFLNEKSRAARRHRANL